MQLSDGQLSILRVLDEQGGFTTRLISKTADTTYVRGFPRQRSAAIRSWLIEMRREGLVDLLDCIKPDAWIRTPAGTEALREG